MARQRGTVATTLPGVEGPGRDPGAVPGQDWHCRGREQQVPTSCWVSVCAPSVRKADGLCSWMC